MPEPPNLEPPDLELIIGEDISVRDPRLRLDGAPGAAPPGATIWVVCLDWWSPPTSTVVADDGSFEMEVTGFDGAEARIQTRTEDLRSMPLDVILHEDASPEQIDWAPCLSLEPLYELDLGETAVGESTLGAVVLGNDCSSTVEVALPPLFIGVDDFSIVTESPFDVPAGGEARIEVSFEPRDEGYLEEILLLEMTGPFEERRPVTLFGHASP